MEPTAPTDVHDLDPEPRVARWQRLPRSYKGGAAVAVLALGVIGAALGGALPGLSDNPAGREGDVRTVPGTPGSGVGGVRAGSPGSAGPAGGRGAGVLQPGEARQPGDTHAVPGSSVADEAPPTTVVLPDGTVVTIPPVVPGVAGSLPQVTVPTLPTTVPRVTVPTLPTTLPKVPVPTTVPTVTVPSVPVTVPTVTVPTLPAVPTTVPALPTVPTTLAVSLPSVSLPTVPTTLPPVTVPRVGL